MCDDYIDHPNTIFTFANPIQYIKIIIYGQIELYNCDDKIDKNNSLINNEKWKKLCKTVFLNYIYNEYIVHPKEKNSVCEYICKIGYKNNIFTNKVMSYYITKW